MNKNTAPPTTLEQMNAAPPTTYYVDRDQNFGNHLEHVVNVDGD